MMSLRQVEHALAPWQSAYSNSKVLSTGIIALHILALLFGGGLAVAADRGTLRALRAGVSERARQLVELHATHRPVLIALSLSFLTGVLQAAADVKTFATAPAFYVKLALVGLLVVNGAVLTLTESSLTKEHAVTDVSRSPLWSRLRASTFASLALWSATLIAGVVLQNAT
jgi:uncharacterized membrane-anchored protein